MRNFKNLKVWEAGMELVLMTYQLTKKFPSTEKYILEQQMRRCAVSIPSNIAEGCRGTNSEMRHFLRIALGSSYELYTQIQLAINLSYLTNDQGEPIMRELIKLQKKLSKFISTFK